jgi:hypothetical protein
MFGFPSKNSKATNLQVGDDNEASCSCVCFGTCCLGKSTLPNAASGSFSFVKVIIITCPVGERDVHIKLILLYFLLPQRIALRKILGEKKFNALFQNLEQLANNTASNSFAHHRLGFVAGAVFFSLFRQVPNTS